jgi:hypothetical protein
MRSLTAISITTPTGSANAWLAGKWSLCQDGAMADVITHDEQGRTFKNGVLQTTSATAAGPIHDAIAALVSAVAPRGLVQRPAKVNQAVEAQSGDLGSQF